MREKLRLSHIGLSLSLWGALSTSVDEGQRLQYKGNSKATS
jgi:hypothetical protein